MTSINAYLNFNGNCEEAFNFYASAFNDTTLNFDRFGGAPDSDHIAGSDKNKIMHASLTVGKNGLLMGSDTTEGMGEVVFGNNFSLSLLPESEEETIRLFNTLSEGGTVTMPLEDMFFGAYFGEFSDKFGINWMINFQNE